MQTIKIIIKKPKVAYFVLNPEEKNGFATPFLKWASRLLLCRAAGM